MVSHLEQQFQTYSWNPLALFIFVCESEGSAYTKKFYSQLVEDFGIQRSILRTPSLLASYDIFAKRLTVHNTSDDINLPSTKHMSNAHGYELRPVAETKHPYMYVNDIPAGPFVEILNIVTASSNITIRWLNENLNQPVVSTHMTNVLLFQCLEGADMVHLVSHDQATTCLLIYEQPNRNISITPLNPFTNLVWTLIVCLAAISLLLANSTQFHFPRNLLLQTLFSPPLPCYRMARIERSALVTLNVLLFTTSTAYLANFIRISCSYKYERHIRSIRDLEQSGMHLYTESSTERVRINTAYPSWNVAGQEQGARIPNNAAITANCIVAEFFEQSPLNQDPDSGIRRQYVLREPLFRDPIGHSFVKSNPLVGRFTEIRDRLFEAGISDWLVQGRVKRGERARRMFRETVLRFTVLRSMWWLLVYGHCCGVFVFIGEIVRSWVIRSR